VSSYAGTVDETAIVDRVVEIGKLIEGAGEVGFVLTYHAPNEQGSGRMELAGSGISQGQLERLLAEALEHNRIHGDTT